MEQTVTSLRTLNVPYWRGELLYQGRSPLYLETLVIWNMKWTELLQRLLKQVSARIHFCSHCQANVPKPFKRIRVKCFIESVFAKNGSAFH